MNEITGHQFEGADPDDRVGRRRHARVGLNVKARLVTPVGAVRVVLLDISASGARIRLSQPVDDASGSLQWLHFAEPVTVIRREGLHCALAFAIPLHDAAVGQTTDFARISHLQRLAARQPDRHEACAVAPNFSASCPD